ncbi:hypothetical protein Q5W97_05230 [Borreliella burgdorferi]|nr:hypothetical protein [Borreliella burgdorferi]MDO7272963.1 hypothetical protein [Borreliella burgdorferi]
MVKKFVGSMFLMSFIIKRAVVV